MGGPLLALTRARLREFFREPGAVFWTFGFPILLTIALGIAFRSQGAPETEVAVLDGPGASELAALLDGSPHLAASVVDEAEGGRRLRAGRIAVLVDAGAGGVAYRLDPTRPEAHATRALVDDLVQRAAGRVDPRPARDEPVEAPGARYVDWLVPGLLGMQLMSGSLWGIAWVIVQARQRKLLKRLLATPMRRRDFLLAHLLSRLLFVVIEVPFLFVFARLAFGVRIHGSPVAVFAVALLGAASFAGMGLLCASRAQNSETANGLVNLLTLPMFVLSGVFFSAARFPELLQPAIRVLPLTALNDALRALVNDGAPVAAVLPQVAILSAWGLVSFVLALRIFRWT